MIIDIQRISNHYYIHLSLKDHKWETHIKHSMREAMSLISFKIEKIVGLLDNQHEVSAGLEFKPERDFSREEMSEIDKDKANLAMKKLRLDHLDRDLKTGAEHLEEELKGEINESKETTDEKEVSTED